jgi:ribosomal protein S18 acetylase RimI-like enzyme
VPFLKDMLRHAYYWRSSSVPESGEPPVQRYVERWGRPGDTALIAIQDFQPVGAAWYRLFKVDNPGYGFVDEETPELAIAVVPSRRGRGIGEALIEALCERAHEDGYHALSLSVERGNAALVAFYEEHGFARVGGGDDYSLTMRRDL